MLLLSRCCCCHACVQMLPSPLLLSNTPSCPPMWPLMQEWGNPAEKEYYDYMKSYRCVVFGTQLAHV